jgi:uncharacterized protein (TIGR02722 family)
MKKAVFILGIVILGLSACTGTSVKRVDPDTQIDLSGYWNDVDVRIVCEALIKDCLSKVTLATRTRGSKPTVIVGRFRNESSEQIDTAIISSTMETTIFNTGILDFVAGGDVRDEIRAERQDQQSNASEATMSRLRNETGADYMLTGAVRSIVDRDGNRTVRTYYVTAEMTSIETNQRIWMGQNNDIKKVITQSSNRL